MQKEDPKQKPPVEPEKDIPVKPDTDPDPTRKREKNDPTRIDDPPPVKPENLGSKNYELGCE